MFKNVNTLALQRKGSRESDIVLPQYEITMCCFNVKNKFQLHYCPRYFRTICDKEGYIVASPGQLCMT